MRDACNWSLVSPSLCLLQRESEEGEYEEGEEDEQGDDDAEEDDVGVEDGDGVEEAEDDAGEEDDEGDGDGEGDFEDVCILLPWAANANSVMSKFSLPYQYIVTPTGDENKEILSSCYSKFSQLTLKDIYHN